MRIVCMIGAIVSIGWFMFFSLVAPITIPLGFTAVVAAIAGFISKRQ